MTANDQILFSILAMLTYAESTNNDALTSKAIQALKAFEIEAKGSSQDQLARYGFIRQNI